MKPLSTSQKRKIRAVLNGSAPIKSLKQPLEWHQLVLHWNWDDGLKELNWIIDQPNCDKGTALLIYWLAGPRYMHQYADVHEVPQEDKELFQLIKKIEELFQNNFYTAEQITFDPKNSLGTDFTSEYTDIEVKDPIPDIMFVPTKGEEVKLETLTQEYIDKIYPIDDVTLQKVQKKINSAFKIVQEKYPSINTESDPSTIVNAMQQIAIDFITTKEAYSVKVGNSFKLFEFLLAHLLVKHYNWKWYKHRLREHVLDFDEPIVVSPDKKFYNSPVGHLFPYFVKGKATIPFITDMFNVIVNIHEYIEQNLKELKEDTTYPLEKRLEGYKYLFTSSMTLDEKLKIVESRIIRLPSNTWFVSNVKEVEW